MQKLTAYTNSPLTDLTEVTKLGIFHNEVLTQYLLFEKVFHLSQYLVHLHHLIHQLPIKITCRETATEEYTMHNTFSFVIIVSETQDGNILKAKKATHCCCLSPVAICLEQTQYLIQIVTEDLYQQYSTEQNRIVCHRND